VDEWGRKLTNAMLPDALSYDRAFVRLCCRSGFRPRGRRSLAHLRRECKRRGLCTKGARPQRAGSPVG
jgi:hypothetical protein